MTPEGELILAAIADFRRHVEKSHDDCLACHSKVDAVRDAITDWTNRPQPILRRDVMDTFAASINIFGKENHKNGNGKKES